MQIVLINSPVSRRSPHASLAPPLGLAYVAGALLREGHRVSAVDFNVSGLNLNRVDLLVSGDSPALVGISASTETYPNAVAIANRVKAANGEIKVILGGPHPTIMPEEVLKEAAIDFVAIGEGEETIAELARHLADGTGDLSQIRGLGYKDGTVRINPRREPLNPVSLPYPARDLFPMEFYADKWSVLTARGGCPYKCPFCSASFIWHGKRRARPPQDIWDELRWLVEVEGAEHVYFNDDIFTLNRKWVFELLALLKSQPLPLTWGCSTRVDLVDRELLQAMADVGCRSMHYGAESGSQKILDSVKGIKKDAVISAVKEASAAGIHVVSSFMMPFPEDTAETIRETKTFMGEVQRAGSKILLSFTTPYPGTLFYDQAEALGVKINATRWDEFDAKHNIMETKHLSAPQIEALVTEMMTDLGLVRSDG